ncbi:MAG: hypothetical protein DMF63_11070 [Acidobacteria bacterium]|nr:MAG: hypothetical protein DMF63_11070 [Acidobacteriota bacterium]
MKRFLITIFMLLMFAASAVAQNDIHAIDFKNFTFSLKCLGDTADKITVINGEYSKETQEDGYVDRFYVKVFEIAYGDVTGDGKDDAIVLTVCNTGGTGNFSEGVIYSMKSGKPSLIARIPGGDRADGGLRTARAEKGVLVVESNEEGEQGGLCCPEFIITTRYKVAAGKLSQLGRTKEPIDRAERITFEKGKSGATFTANVGGSDSKKFVVGARAGQTLMVSVGSERSAVRLITAARVTEGEHKFSAVLPKSGDYIFEVSNESATEDEITITVKIQ